MQYIKKGDTPPPDWDSWFTTTTNIRSYDYGADDSILLVKKQAKKFLIEEQHGLCAYCQQKIEASTASIEHVLPKQLNKERSTCYTNLVAVCKIPNKDKAKDNRDHCDKEKGSKIITPFIFLSDCDVTNLKNNAYFSVSSTGFIYAKPNQNENHRVQVEAYIDTLNLNHSDLKDRRVNDMLKGLIDGYIACDQRYKKLYWKTQFNRILAKKNTPFRQFLLIYMWSKAGLG